MMIWVCFFFNSYHLPFPHKVVLYFMRIYMVSNQVMCLQGIIWHSRKKNCFEVIQACVWISAQAVDSLGLGGTYVMPLNLTFLIYEKWIMITNLWSCWMFNDIMSIKQQAQHQRHRVAVIIYRTGFVESQRLKHSHNEVSLVAQW